MEPWTTVDAFESSKLTNLSSTVGKERCGSPYLNGAIVLSVMFFAGLGNGLVIGSSYLDSEIRKGGLLPMLSLAVTDLVFAEFSCSIMFVNLVWPSCIIPDYVCIFLSTVELSLVIAVMYQHSLLAFTRYIAICHPVKYKPLFEKRRILIGLIILFIGCFAAVILPTVTPSFLSGDQAFMMHDYDVSMLICSYTVTLGNMIYSGILYFIIPVGIGSFCYISCIVKLRGANSVDSQTSKHMKLALTMLMTYSLVLLNSAPFPIAGLVYPSPSECSLVKRHFCWLILFNSCSNPIVYAWKSVKFRRMFARQLGFKIAANAVNAESTAIA